MGRGFKRRKFGSRRFSKRGGLRKQVRRVSKQVKRITRNIETKYWDSYALLNNADIPLFSAAPSANEISRYIVQGDQQFQRNGSKVSLKTLHLRGVIARSAAETAGDIGTRIRFIVFKDKYNQGAAPTWNDFFEASTGGNYDSFRRWYNRKRFHVYWDKQFTLPPIKGYTNASVVNQIGQYHIIKKTIKLKTMTIYRATGDTIADNGINSIWYFIFRSDTQTAASKATLSFRLTYQDL